MAEGRGGGCTGLQAAQGRVGGATGSGAGKPREEALIFEKCGEARGVPIFENLGGVGVPR